MSDGTNELDGTCDGGEEMVGDSETVGLEDGATLESLVGNNETEGLKDGVSLGDSEGSAETDGDALGEMRRTIVMFAVLSVKSMLSTTISRSSPVPSNSEIVKVSVALNSASRLENPLFVGPLILECTVT